MHLVKPANKQVSLLQCVGAAGDSKLIPKKGRQQDILRCRNGVLLALSESTAITVGSIPNVNPMRVDQPPAGMGGWSLILVHN